VQSQIQDAYTMAFPWSSKLQLHIAFMVQMCDVHHVSGLRTKVVASWKGRLIRSAQTVPPTLSMQVTCSRQMPIL
jgi:hypothetical protein